MHAKARRILVLIPLAWLVSGLVADVAAANTGGCKRRRQPPNQNLFWVCVDPGAACGNGRECQTVHYGGIVPYSTCECLSSVSDPNDFSYGTGGIWNTNVTNGVPGPGASVEITLVDGPNALVVYPNADITGGSIQNAQVFTGSGDAAGSFTIQMENTPGDSIAAHVTALSLSLTSFSFEGSPTGTNTLTLAPDGATATGHWIAAAHSFQFDEPVHCLVTNALAGSAHFYFRPILTEGLDGKMAMLNPFEMFCTGSYASAQSVPVVQRQWGNMKNLFR